MYGINHCYTTLYSPQSNASERVYRSLIAGIRAYLKNDHRQWDENLSSISCALRNSLHQSIHTTPCRSLFGFDMITHASSYQLLIQTRLLKEADSPLSRDDHLQQIRHDLQKHLKEAYQRNQHQYNLRARPQIFKEGQEVFRRNFVQSNFEKGFNAKLSPVFIKSRIKQKIGNHYNLLEDMEGKWVGTFHGKDLRS